MADSVCPICLDEILLGENLALTNCKHKFHLDCILENGKNAPCPLCRKSLLNKHIGIADYKIEMFVIFVCLIIMFAFLITIILIAP